MKNAFNSLVMLLIFSNLEVSGNKHIVMFYV